MLWLEKVHGRKCTCTEKRNKHEQKNNVNYTYSVISLGANTNYSTISECDILLKTNILNFIIAKLLIIYKYPILWYNNSSDHYQIS